MPSVQRVRKISESNPVISGNPHSSLNNQRVTGHYHELQKYWDGHTSPVSSLLSKVINAIHCHTLIYTLHIKQQDTA